MEKLSKEELLAIINKDKKPPRKKAELTAEKRAELLERLSDMRETVKKNREAKKAPEPEKDLDAIFEKKYNSKFEKIEATLSEVSDGQKELIRLKKEKQAKKVAESQPPKVSDPPKTAEVTKAPEPIKAAEPIKAPEVPRNPNVFLKGRTRF